MEAETAAHRLMAPFRCKQVAGRRNSGRREWYMAEPELAVEAIKQARGICTVNPHRTDAI
jgi:hypothetical protein